MLTFTAAIVKLFLHYANQKPGQWSMATGWLIKPDLLVTAGHCAFDWSHNLGRLVSAKAYIGYAGKKSINDPKFSVQFCMGKQIATTTQWLTSKGQRPHDVSFMKLAKAFTGIEPIRFTETPPQGFCQLGVVGYPGDLKDEATNEKGAYMYEHFLNTGWNLEDSQDRMLEYTMDTFGGMLSIPLIKLLLMCMIGNSGSPVLRQKDMVSIGAHVYGGPFNSASVIGLLGNPYYDYIAAFDIPAAKYEKSGLKTVKGLSYVRIPANTIPQDVNKASTALALHPPKLFPTVGVTAPNGVPSKGAQKFNRTSNDFASPDKARPSQNYAESDEEGFFDIFKAVVKTAAPIAGNILKTGLPIVLGPVVGGPVGALAGVALSAAGRLAESAEESLDAEPNNDGVVERAILGEAALAAVMSKKRAKLESLGVFKEMGTVVNQLNPAIKQASPHIMGAVMEPALRVTLDALNQSSNPNAESITLDIPTSSRSKSLKISSPRKVTQSNRPGSDQLVAGLEAKFRESEGEEGFFDTFASIASTAFNIGKTVVQTGLPILVNAISGGAESVGDDQAAPVTSPLDDLSKRAMLGEAALQALTKLPPDTLEEEGFFDDMVSTIKRIAPVVINAAPGVIKAVTPIVSGFMKNSSGAESAVAGKGQGRTKGHKKGVSHANILNEFLDD